MSLNNLTESKSISMAFVLFGVRWVLSMLVKTGFETFFAGSLDFLLISIELNVDVMESISMIDGSWLDISGSVGFLKTGSGGLFSKLSSSSSSVRIHVISGSSVLFK